MANLRERVDRRLKRVLLGGQAHAVVHRHRTAIKRYRCSRPVALALAEGLITKKTSVFDYGCGHGADIQYLRARRIRVDGWDPHYRSKARLKPADVVNLGYVLNVIEQPRERVAALRRAFELARSLLIVAVRADRAIDSATEFGDGFITGTQTFQKIYTQEELVAFVVEVLGKAPHLAGPGIAYTFKSDAAEASYLANRAFTRRLEYRTDLVADFGKNGIARRFVREANKLGRLPSGDEFPGYDELVEAFGSGQRIERLTLRLVDRSAFEGSRTDRREDILTYFAMLRLQNLRPPPFGVLPQSIQRDVRALWPSYAASISEGERFLFDVGRPELVRAACGAASVGKLLPTDLYVHRSAEDDLPALLRVLLFAAKRIVGQVAYDVAKIALDGRAVSFLAYPNFDAEPHPALVRSVRVYLPRAAYDARDYSAQANTPILHRKDTLVAPTYPHFEKFRRLTVAEEKAGLLEGAPGYRTEWETLLAGRGFRIAGHRLAAAT